MCVGYDGVIPALVLLQVACIVITEEGIHHIRLLDLMRSTKLSRMYIFYLKQYHQDKRHINNATIDIAFFGKLLVVLA